MVRRKPQMFCFGVILPTSCDSIPCLTDFVSCFVILLEPRMFFLAKFKY